MLNAAHVIYEKKNNSSCVPGSINSHYFHIIGDKLINPIVGVYIPIIRIPIKGGMTIPSIATFDHGTCEICDVMVLKFAGWNCQE